MSDLKYAALRRKLVEELRLKGITDENVLQAIGKVERHRFFEKTILHSAYVDKAFPIGVEFGSGQTISQPYIVALESQLLEIKRGDKVLEIGTGSGYQCAVLTELGAQVYSIERQEKLFNHTFKLLHELSYRPKLLFGDGYKGWPAYAPFDKIIITAAPPQVPQDLLQQLAIGGVMVTPVGTGNQQELLKIMRVDEHNFSTQKFGSVAFVPMLSGLNH
jgi:protein-L-isoaspartate(D-aspartate) O-methyltransferase